MNNDKPKRYCLDTNVVSDALRRQTDVIRHMGEAADNGSKLFICSLVYYEVVRGLKAAGFFRRLREFSVFYENFPHLYFDKESMAVVEQATDIYAQLHKGQQIEDTDIFIAAIAIANDCTLVTANIRHFERIADLKFVNWRE